MQNMSTIKQSNDLNKQTDVFETSRKKQESRVRGKKSKMHLKTLILNIFANTNSEKTPLFHQCFMKEEIRLSFQKFVGVCQNQAIDICIATQRQGKDPAWFDER